MAKAELLNFLRVRRRLKPVSAPDSTNSPMPKMPPPNGCAMPFAQKP